MVVMLGPGRLPDQEIEAKKRKRWEKKMERP